MNIVVLEEQSAGNMYNLCSAVNKHTKHNATLIGLSKHMYRYPSTILVNKENTATVRESIYQADGVVFKESHKIPKQLGLDLKKLSNVVVIFGGMGYRWRSLRNANLKTYGSIPQVKWAFTSINFLEQAPNGSWIPRCIRLQEWRDKYDYSKREPPLIAISPAYYTNHTFQITVHFEQIIQTLKKRRIKFQHSIIRGKKNSVCLKLKAPASVFFDRIAPIYGINSIEAAGFEAAIVTGTSTYSINALEDLGFPCPFIIVKTPRDAANAVVELFQDRDYMKKKGLECYKFVERVYSGKESATRLINLLRDKHE